MLNDATFIKMSWQINYDISAVDMFEADRVESAGIMDGDNSRILASDHSQRRKRTPYRHLMIRSFRITRDIPTISRTANGSDTKKCELVGNQRKKSCRSKEFLKISKNKS